LFTLQTPVIDRRDNACRQAGINGKKNAGLKPGATRDL
jgi:hypothetical protein